jgi:hypothetical protein
VNDADSFSWHGTGAREFVRVESQVKRIAAEKHDALTRLRFGNHWDIGMESVYAGRVFGAAHGGIADYNLSGSDIEHANREN